MSGNRLVKLFHSGSEADLLSVFKPYVVDENLKILNRESVDIFENYDKSDLKIAKTIKIVLPVADGFYKSINHNLAVWSLIDLAYYLIKASDDNSEYVIESEQELCALSSSVENYIAQGYKDNRTAGENESNSIFFKLWGFVGEQIKYQRINTIFDNMYRDIFILTEINTPEIVDIEKILYEETGLTSWKTVVGNLYRAWEAFKHVDTLSEIIDGLQWGSQENLDGFKRVIARFTTDYKEVKDKGRQQLCGKPYVKTQKGDVVCVNAFLSLFLCEHGVYWIVRDYINKNNPDKLFFPNYFGDLFERYFEKVLADCLSADEYEKLMPYDHIKRADWKLHIGNWKILIEQKSKLMRIAVKQQNTNTKDFVYFVKDAALEAISQLKGTEDEFGDGKYIKIILLYEDYLKPEALENIMTLPECTVEDDCYYWIVTIREMEMLLYLSKNDRILFDRIIKEKIDRETHRVGIGRSVEYILSDFGIVQNDYIYKMDFVKELMLSNQNV